MSSISLRDTKTRTLSPGQIIVEEFLIPMSISLEDLSVRTDIPYFTLCKIVYRGASISEFTSDLARVFGVPADFWENLQKHYDETATLPEFEP